nr:MAG TPA: hypothetical protein [Bacteriophage sp.]
MELNELQNRLTNIVSLIWDLESSRALLKALLNTISRTKSG